MARKVTEDGIRQYRGWLERSSVNRATVEQYIAGIGKLMEYLGGKEVTQETLDGFKAWLVDEKKHKKSSTNSYIMSVRSFCRAMEWGDLTITAYSLGPVIRNNGEKYITRADYSSIVEAAMGQGEYWLAMLVQTLCHMDLRYSEIGQVTAEAVWEGRVEVARRKNIMHMEMPDYLQESLEGYIRWAGIDTGVVFRTSRGKVVNRSNVWKDLKRLEAEAGLEKGRVTLQNLKMPRMHDYYPFYPMPDV